MPKAKQDKRADNPLRTKLVAVVTETLGCDGDEVTDGASFCDDLGADSLDAVELVMMVEDEFLDGEEIPDDEAEKLATFGDLYRYVDRRTARVI